MERWTINKTEIDRLAKHFGLVHDVKVTPTNELRRGVDFMERGRYIGRDENGVHIIEIAEDQPAIWANESTIHEMTHAAQRERDGDERAKTIYVIADVVFGYDQNPYEVEARRVATALKDQFNVIT